MTFCGVGMINTIAGLAVILLLSEFLNVHYMLANALGYAFGLGIGFILHRNITFKYASDNDQKRTELLKFILVFAFAYLVQLAALYALVHHTLTPRALAQILAIGIYTILNYLGNRYFTFHNKKDISP